MIIGLILVMATGILLAQRDIRNATDNNPMGMCQMPDPGQTCMQELNLNEAQLNKFAESRAAFQKQENTLRAEINNLRLDLVAAMKAENMKRVKELNKQISDKELQLQNARVDLMSNYMKELNKEQKAIMQKHMPMMMGHGFHPQMSSRNRFSGRMMHRRAPGMGERQHDCENDCDDCDGQRKFKNRK